MSYASLLSMIAAYVTKCLSTDVNNNCRAMLARDWLSKGAISKGIMDGHLDASMVEKGRSYINAASSVNASQIDVDILRALDDLKLLKLIDQNGVKEEEESQDTIKQLWGDALD